MPQVVIFQHVAHEILGTLHGQLKERSIRLKYYNFERHPDIIPVLEGASGLIILGGPMNVDQTKKYPHLREEINAINFALRHDIPVLGICLGSQLIAKALGAKVRQMPQPEIGWHAINPTTHAASDPYLSPWMPGETIFHWHEDTFDLPHGAIHLASSFTCHHQAFSYGPRVYGFQFHLEVDLSMLQRWCHHPQLSKQLQSVHGHNGAEVILSQAADKLSRLESLSRTTFGALLDLMVPMRPRLPSR
jgi:GMP synthase (glutamine-hydrolysing)